jgi:hypothetical protein
MLARRCGKKRLHLHMAASSVCFNLQVVCARPARLSTPIPAITSIETQQVVHICLGMDLYRLHRQYWPSGNSEESCRSLFWPFGILVRLVLSMTMPFLQSNPHGRCWITVQYPAAQTFLEYMLEWTSAFFSFILYMAVLLRVRGNLIQDSNRRWSLRWIPRSESWQLGFARDYLDSCTVKMAAIIVWCVLIRIPVMDVVDGPHLFSGTPYVLRPCTS